MSEVFKDKVAALTGGPTEQLIAEHLKSLSEQDGATRRAIATALPGPLQDAFAPCQDVKCGPYMVRPFYDIDFEWFAMLNHPLDAMFKDAMEGRGEAAAESVTKMLPRGLPAWQAFWIMTHTVDEVEALLSKPEGVEELNRAAKKEFSRLQTKALTALYEAVMIQIQRSNQTAIEYGEAETEAPAPAEGKPVVPLEPLPQTGSGG